MKYILVPERRCVKQTQIYHAWLKLWLCITAANIREYQLSWKLIFAFVRIAQPQPFANINIRYSQMAWHEYLRYSLFVSLSTKSSTCYRAIKNLKRINHQPKLLLACGITWQWWNSETLRDYHLHVTLNPLVSRWSLALYGSCASTRPLIGMVVKVLQKGGRDTRTCTDNLWVFRCTRWVMCNFPG